MPTIIRNGITYGGSSGGGGGGTDSGSITFDLLWTNASPTSNFTEQTIKLDLTGYTAVYFYYKFLANVTDGAYGGRLFPINNVSFSIAEGYFDANNLVVRHGYLKSDSIGFSNGIKNGSTNNSAIIPYKIYGVK